ncbi:rhodanese-like domain-containing protein [Inhella gelatinilytica]|uniref:Rhodanese-like domain-containing protein n=1 Tax=Inhella gelatinilytica TaxID=2795030 RepID=A0A931IUT2_9BURK|nr:rhodanese-like domain-containing protein [Inhella gelatinilytica]MBH9552342.1 rhodanese-like domain-containing protein [Inhella gelatinilytica]
MNRRTLLCLAPLLVLPPRTLAQDAASVTLDQARAAVEAGRRLIDVREPSEHATGIAPGAQRLPMSELPQRLGQLPSAKDEPFLLICRTQNRSKRVAQQLKELGYTRVQFVEGGMAGWAARGWPLETPPKTP